MIRYHASWLLPISMPAVRNGTVVVDEQGRIAYVGPSDAAPPGEDRNLGAAVLMPGLINVHSHLELTAMRGFLEDLPFREWILRLHRSKSAVLTEERLLHSACAGIAEGLLAGITTYADTCDTGVAMSAMLAMGVRGRMYQEVFGPDPESWRAELDGLHGKVEALRHPGNASGVDPLVDVGISPHAPYTVCDDLFAASARYAVEERLPMAVHIAESEEEHTLVCEGKGVFAEGLRRRGIEVSPRALSPVRLLARLGVLETKPLLIHCLRVDEEDLRLIAESGSAVAHCPVANAKLGHGIAPVARMLEKGIEVALGSDSVAANNRMDLLEEARIACLMQRAVLRSPAALPPPVVIAMATLASARVLGLEKRVGSLERGKDADLAAFSLESLRGQPVEDPCSALVFSLGGSRARLVTVRGRELVRDGELVAHDAGSLATEVGKVGRELRRWLVEHPTLETSPHP